MLYLLPLICLLIDPFSPEASDVPQAFLDDTAALDEVIARWGLQGGEGECDRGGTCRTNSDEQMSDAYIDEVIARWGRLKSSLAWGFYQVRIKKIPYEAPQTQLGPRKCTFWINAFLGPKYWCSKSKVKKTLKNYQKHFPTWRRSYIDINKVRILTFKCISKILKIKPLTFKANPLKIKGFSKDM